MEQNGENKQLKTVYQAPVVVMVSFRAEKGFMFSASDGVSNYNTDAMRNWDGNDYISDGVSDYSVDENRSWF